MISIILCFLRSIMADKRNSKVTSPLGRSFDRHLPLLDAYVQRHGHACVPVAHVEQGAHLGRWVAAQRSRKAAGLLTQEQIDCLEGYKDWVWRASDFRWDFAIECLEAFYEREGHVNVANNHIENRFELGDWLQRQRKRYRAGRLTEKQRAQIERFPFDFKKWMQVRKRMSWEARMSLLKAYVKRNGHARVPRFHKEEGFTLGVWVNSLRTQHSNGRLKPEQVRELEGLKGWRWAKPRQV